jgi:hypothetical protein
MILVDTGQPAVPRPPLAQRPSSPALPPVIDRTYLSTEASTALPAPSAAPAHHVPGVLSRTRAPPTTSPVARAALAPGPPRARWPQNQLRPHKFDRAPHASNGGPHAPRHGHCRGTTVAAESESDQTDKDDLEQRTGRHIPGQSVSPRGPSCAARAPCAPLQPPRYQHDSQSSDHVSTPVSFWPPFCRYYPGFSAFFGARN